MMPNEQQSGISPKVILNQLQKHDLVVQDSRLCRSIKLSSEVLDVMMSTHFDRCVPDEVAGAIATIIGMACCGRSVLPIVMVTCFENKKNNVGMLDKVVSALCQLGYLPHTYRVTEKYPQSNYFCFKRYHNAVANGHKFAAGVEKSLLTRRLNPAEAKRLCVQGCSHSCKYYDVCKYQHLLASMMDGTAKVQVYDEQQYMAAIEANKLPKSRMTVYSVSGRKILSNDGARILTEAELRALLNRCDAAQQKSIRKRKDVHVKTEHIRQCAFKLFAMATVTTNEKRARELLAIITADLRDIRCEIKKDFKNTERSELFQVLTRLIDKISKMSVSNSLTVTHKNQGKRALIAA